RYERPETLEYEYSIAAVPGTPTAILPLGPFVLPGAYRIRLSAGGETADQSLEVAMDPRVKISADQATRLLELPRRVGAALARTAGLERARRHAARLLAAALEDPKAKTLAAQVAGSKVELEKLTASREEEPARANAALTALETDLESADAEPTSSQRDMLA